MVLPQGGKILGRKVPKITYGLERLQEFKKKKKMKGGKRNNGIT